MFSRVPTTQYSRGKFRAQQLMRSGKCRAVVVLERLQYGLRLSKLVKQIVQITFYRKLRYIFCQRTVRWRPCLSFLCFNLWASLVQILLPFIHTDLLISGTKSRFQHRQSYGPAVNTILIGVSPSPDLHSSSIWVSLCTRRAPGGSFRRYISWQKLAVFHYSHKDTWFSTLIAELGCRCTRCACINRQI